MHLSLDERTCIAVYTRQKIVKNNYENEIFGSNYPYALASHGVKLGRATQARVGRHTLNYSN